MQPPGKKLDDWEGGWGWYDKGLWNICVVPPDWLWTHSGQGPDNKGWHAVAIFWISNKRYYSFDRNQLKHRERGQLNGAGQCFHRILLAQRSGRMDTASNADVFLVISHTSIGRDEQSFQVRILFRIILHTTRGNISSSFLSIYDSTGLCWTIAVFQFLDLFTQLVGFLGWRIRASRGRYLHTG